MRRDTYKTEEIKKKKITQVISKEVSWDDKLEDEKIDVQI